MHPIDETVGVVGDFGMDAPLLAGAAERLIATGVTTLCIIGGCASLQRSIAPGMPFSRLTQSTMTGRRITTSQQITTRPQPLMNRLKKLFADAGIPTHTGPIWTTDAFFRETIPEVCQFSKEGVLSIEMEAATLFAVAEFHGIDAAAVLDVHDYVTVEEWIFVPTAMSSSLVCSCRL